MTSATATTSTASASTDANDVADTSQSDVRSQSDAYTAPELIWVLLCFAGGAFLRAANLAARPLWGDELTTIITARRAFWDGLTTAQDPQPPLHQWLVRLIMNIKGDPLLSESLLRLPACAFGIGAILAVWWAARQFLGRFGAAIAILLVAVNPVLVHHARDARPYSLYVFFAVLSMAFFYRLVKQGGTRNVIGYAITTGGMFLSHYYAMFFVAAQIAFVVIDFILAGSQGDTRKRFKTIMLGFVAAFVLSLPSIALFARLLLGGMQGSWWISVPSPIEGVDALGELLGVSSVGVLCLIPLVSAVWRSRSVFDDPDTNLDNASSLRRASWQQWWLQRQKVLFLTIFVGVVLFLPIAASIAMGKGAWISRYSLPVLAPMMFLGLIYLRRVGPTATGIVIVLMVAFMAPKSMRQPRLTGPFKEEAGFRHAVQTLNGQLQPSDNVVLPAWPFSADYQNTTALGMEYYKYDGPPLQFVNIHELNAYLYGYDPEGQVTKERYEEVKANGHEFLPDGRTYLVCFHSTVKSFKEFMRRQGRAYSTREFGLYEDGRTPMYTLVMVAPRGATVQQ